MCIELGPAHQKAGGSIVLVWNNARSRRWHTSLCTACPVRERLLQLGNPLGVVGHLDGLGDVPYELPERRGKLKAVQL